MSKKSGPEVFLLHRHVVRRILPHQDLTKSIPSVPSRQISGLQRRDGVKRTTKLIGLTPKELEIQLELDNAADILRRVFLGPKAVYRSRAINQRMYNFHFKTLAEIERYKRPYLDALKRQRKEGGSIQQPQLLRQLDVLGIQEEQARSLPHLDDSKTHAEAVESPPHRDTSRAEKEEVDYLPHSNTSKTREGEVEYLHHQDTLETQEEDVDSLPHLDASKTQSEGSGSLGPSYYRLRTLPNALSMDLVRSQFRSCLASEDFTMVASVLIKKEMGPEILANPSLQRTLQKWLVQRLDSHRVLEFLSLLITRLDNLGQKCEIGIIWSALIAAAQTHNTTAVRRFLKMWRIHNDALDRTMDPEAFRELLGALHHGYKNLAEGSRFNPSAMLEIMFGFSDPAFRGPYHLMKYVDLEDWEALELWTEILIDLKADEHIWDTWELISRRNRLVWEKWSRKGHLTNAWHIYPPRIFIHSLFRTGQPERAWQVFKRGGDGIMIDDFDTWNILYDHAELKCDLDSDLQAKVEKAFCGFLTHRISHLERKLGLKWIPPQDEHSEGFHKPTNNISRALERLSSESSYLDPKLAPERWKWAPGRPKGKILHNPGKAIPKSEREGKISQLEDKGRWERIDEMSDEHNEA